MPEGELSTSPELANSQQCGDSQIWLYESVAGS
jgi:hypothetical protein